MVESVWIRGGIITDVVWVDKNVIAWCMGVHIVFFDLTNLKDSVHWCPDDFDGVSCLSGNPAMRLLCFAEKCSKPRLLLYTYPTMSVICECSSDSEQCYIATAFVSSNFIISLTSCPNYLITIWNWKTGEKVTSIPSPIHDLQGQSIKVSDISRSPMIAQLGRDSGKLWIWKMVATSTIVMTCGEVILPLDVVPVDVDWSTDYTDEQLAIVDKHGHVYICNKDGSEVTRIIFSQRCGVCSEYETPAVCWFLRGIMLKTTFCQIRFYTKKEETIWKRERYVKSELKPHLITRHPFEMNKLYYFTTEGYLMEMILSDSDDQALNIQEKFHYGAFYNLCDFIYPWGHDLVTIDSSFFTIIDVMTARIIGKLRMNDEVSQLLSHPDYPIVAITTKNGMLIIVAVNVPKNPTMAFKYHLQTDELDLVKFSQCGRHLIVGEKKTGICYCITSTHDITFSLIYQLRTKHRITDAILYDDNGTLKVLILGLSSRRAHVGHYVFIYELRSSEEKFMEPTNVIQLPTLYQHLHYAPKNPKILITTPYLSKQIHYFRIKSNEEIVLIKAIATSHKVRQLKIHCNRQYITTSGFDGMVTIFNNIHSPEATTILLSHHRKDLGVSKAICSPYGNHVIVLGRNGTLVSLKLKQNDKEHPQDESERRKMVLSDYSNLNATIFAMLSRPCQIIPPAMVDMKMTWVQWKREQDFLHENEKCRGKILHIQEQFDELKNKVKILLDHNENCPDREKLPIATFDLAVFTREQKLKDARAERDDLRLQLEFESTTMDKVADWIKTMFWDTQSIVSKSIFSIFGDVHVTNYPTTPEDPQRVVTIQRLMSSSEISVNERAFRYSIPKYYAMIKHQYRPSRQDEKSLIESLLIHDNEYEDEEKEKERSRSEPTTTHRFIQPTSRFCQFEDYTFEEFILMTKDLNNDIQQLKNYFNKLFEEMVTIKEHEIAVINEKIGKIRHIDFELRTMFGQSISKIVDQPQWQWQEQPEWINKVRDSEIKVKPFVSASQQALLDKQTVELERMRLLMMADDFREKALLVMMDGVLEVRWEDIIKKNIPKPQCMLTKEPEQYNVEDILSVEKYEKDVQILLQEREKYRRILENDFKKINKKLHDRIDKFNSSLQDLILVKMKIDSAIQQIDFIHAREFVKATQRLQIDKKMSMIQEAIVEKEKSIREFQELNHILLGLLPSLRTRRDELHSKEKMMIKKFSKEFPSLSKVTVDLLRKQYNKRPKVSLKNTTADTLLELGKCIVENSSDYINSHALEYLASVNTIDIKPAALADSVTSQHWNHLVTVRRRKIDIEMSLKANSMELNEIERAIAENLEKIANYKTEISNMENQLIEMKQNQREFELNIEIQLVLKMGQVEMDVAGMLGETSSALFLPRTEISKINDEIDACGAEKIAAMKSAIAFHNDIIYKEWQHQYLKMKMDDLVDELHEISHFNVTKDTQIFLRRLSLGLKEDKTLHQLEREIAAMTKSSRKMLMNAVNKLESIETKIEAKKRSNSILDKAITQMNIKRWEMELKRDLKGEDREKEFAERKLALALRRAGLMRKIQQEFMEISTLRTDYERYIQKYPTLPFIRVVGDENVVKEI